MQFLTRPFIVGDRVDLKGSGGSTGKTYGRALQQFLCTGTCLVSWLLFKANLGRVIVLPATYNPSSEVLV